MNRIYKIETIAQGIMAGYYGCRQNAGTEYQKWTHAILQADQIYKGDLIIDEDTLSNEAYHFCKNNDLIL